MRDECGNANAGRMRKTRTRDEYETKTRRMRDKSETKTRRIRERAHPVHGLGPVSRAGVLFERTNPRFPLGSRGQYPVRFIVGSDMALQVDGWKVPGTKARLNEGHVLCTWDVAPMLAEWMGANHLIEQVKARQPTLDDIPTPGRAYYDAVLPKLRRHQPKGIEFVSTRSWSYLADDLRCLSGDVEISVNRGGCARRMSLAHLVYKFNGGISVGSNKIQNTWKPNCVSKIQSINEEGYLVLNRVTAAASAGMKQAFRLTTESGSIVSSADHRFSTPQGWARLHELTVGDLVHQLVYPSKQPSGVRKGRVRDVAGMEHHPYARCVFSSHPTQNRWVSKLTHHRLQAEATINNLEFTVYIQRVRRGEIDGLQFLDPKVYAVHHKNENPHDNSPGNLEVLTHKDHHTQHAKERGWKNVTAKQQPSKIVSLEEVAPVEMFDLSMADPYNNFVANEFVVHNSGKSLTCITSAKLVGAKRVLILTPNIAKWNWPKEIFAWTGESTLILEGRSGREAREWCIACRGTGNATAVGVSVCAACAGNGSIARNVHNPGKEQPPIYLSRSQLESVGDEDLDALVAEGFSLNAEVVRGEETLWASWRAQHGIDGAISTLAASDATIQTEIDARIREGLNASANSRANDPYPVYRASPAYVRGCRDHRHVFQSSRDGEFCAGCVEDMFVATKSAQWTVANYDIVIPQRENVGAGRIARRTDLDGWGGMNGPMRLAAYDLVILDECFPSGTLIDSIPIERVKIGDYVTAYDHKRSALVQRKVKRIYKSKPRQMVRVHFADRTVLACTANHPIYTSNRGYVKACLLTPDDIILRKRHEMLDLSHRIHAISECRTPDADRPTHQGLLFSQLQVRSEKRSRGGRMSDENAYMARQTHDSRCPANEFKLHSLWGSVFGCYSCGQKTTEKRQCSCILLSTLHQHACYVRPRYTKTYRGCCARQYQNAPGFLVANERVKSNEEGRNARKSQDSALENGTQADRTRRERKRANCTRDAIIDSITVAYERDHKHGRTTSEPESLQGGCRAQRLENRDRNRWLISQPSRPARARRQENESFNRIRVDSVKILESGDNGTFGGVCPDGYVYNFEVEEHHNYFANGILVHNCHDLRILDYQSWSKTRRARGERVYDALVPTQQAVGLSGTPTCGRIADWWPQLNILSKGLMGPPRWWDTRYCLGHEGLYSWENDGAGPLSKTELVERQQHYMLRRLRAEINPDLPPVVYQVVTIEVPAKELHGRDSASTKAAWRKEVRRLSSFKHEHVVNAVLDEMANKHKTYVLCYHVVESRMIQKAIEDAMHSRGHVKQMREANAKTWIVNGDLTKADDRWRQRTCDAYVAHQGAGVLVATYHSMKGAVSIRGAIGAHCVDFIDEPDVFEQASKRGADLDAKAPGTRGYSVIIYEIHGSLDSKAVRILLPKLKAIDGNTRNEDARALGDAITAARDRERSMDAAKLPDSLWDSIMEDSQISPNSHNLNFTYSDDGTYEDVEE